MSLSPVLYHYFRVPLPYVKTFALQEQLHALQLAQRRASESHKDLLLLLEHRPVYTTGRRQLADSEELQAEEERLTRIGADFVTTQRGGQITYHGPGQIVGYPLLDLGRTSPPMGIRDYICRMQKTLKSHLLDNHGIQSIPSDNTGVFLDEHTKIASIGVQVRHRLTTHGFSLNVTPEPKSWFKRVVACGLVGVDAGCIADATTLKEEVTVAGEIDGLVKKFGQVYERDMVKLDPVSEGEIGSLILSIEEEARKCGPWHHEPLP
ncbi:chloroplast lipoate protein ligase [Abortiporus biennis]|nr:chloroplast lipoate protein ligase [Abortiporus biennis]